MIPVSRRTIAIAICVCRSGDKRVDVEVAEFLSGRSQPDHLGQQ